MRKIKLRRLSVLFIILFFSGSFPALGESTGEETHEITDLTLEELLHVKITSASKFEESLLQTPATIIVISRSDIERRGYTSLNEVLADLPGLDVIIGHSDVTQLIYSRGNSTGSLNERTMLLVDGVESNMLYTQHMGLESDFPLSAVERVEIMYGPASAVYGANAFSGVINIVTRSPADLPESVNREIIARAGAGSFNTVFGEMSYLAKINGLGLSLSYRRFRSDRHDISHRPGFFANGVILGNPAIWGPFAEIYPKYENTANDNGLLIKILLGDLEAGINRFTTIHGEGAQYPFDKTLPTKQWKFFKNIYHLRYKKNITGALHWNLLTTYQYDGAGPDSVFTQAENAGKTWNSARTVQMMTWKFISSKWNFYSDFLFRPGAEWTVSGGVKYARGEYQKGYELGKGDLITFMPGDTEYSYSQLFPQPLNEGQTPGNLFQDNEWGLYSQVKWSPRGKKMNMVLGARYDNNDIYGDTFNPRVGVTWEPLTDLLFKANYGTAFQAPAPRNLYAKWGGLTVSAALDPDHIQTIDFSALLRSKNISHDITFYYNRIAKSIQQGVNLPDKNVYGLEYKLNLFLFSLGKMLENARVHFNYSLTEAKYSAPRHSLTTGRSSDKVENIARHKFNFILDADWTRNLHMNIKFNFVSQRPTVVSNPAAETGSFLLTSLGFQYKHFIKGFSFFLHITNLFDITYDHPGYDSADAGEDLSAPSRGWYSSRLPQPGRAFMAGIRAEL